MPTPPPDGGLAVEVDPDAPPPCGHVRVRGELDLATAPLLARRLAPLVEDGSRCLHLHLDEVPFCDVTGLTALLQISEQLRGRGGRLHLSGACPTLQRMLDVLGLSATLEPVPVPRDAAADDAADRPT